MRLLALAFATVLAPLTPALAADTETAAAAPPAGAVPLGLQLMFRMVDRDSDGAVSQGEADRFVDGLFAQVDGNKDGLVSWAELNGILGSLAPQPQQRRQAKRAFERIDRNHDGHVDGREINRAAVEHFRFLDADRNGAVTLADLAGRDLFAPALGAAAP